MIKKERTLKESKEKLVLSRLANKHPECAVRIEKAIRGRQFFLKDGRKLHYWGSRTDLSAATVDAVGFGLSPHPWADNSAKKPKINPSPGCFFFLFKTTERRVLVQLLKLVTNNEGIVFQPFSCWAGI